MREEEEAGDEGMDEEEEGFDGWEPDEEEEGVGGWGMAGLF